VPMRVGDGPYPNTRRAQGLQAGFIRARPNRRHAPSLASQGAPWSAARQPDRGFETAASGECRTGHRDHGGLPDLGRQWTLSDCRAAGPLAAGGIHLGFWPGTDGRAAGHQRARARCICHATVHQAGGQRADRGGRAGVAFHGDLRRIHGSLDAAQCAAHTSCRSPGIAESVASAAPAALCRASLAAAVAGAGARAALEGRRPGAIGGRPRWPCCWCPWWPSSGLCLR
jgi:hypothetical protein